ncbi:MAG: hypothetical protein ACRC5C_11115 [Bacilli bacterium]
MSKINESNIIKSFFLGAFIGLLLQFGEREQATFTYRLLVILSSGGMGFLIGFLTEWITARIPISIANARNYFLINTVIALGVTTCVMIAALLVSGEASKDVSFLPVLSVVLAIVTIANVVDYLFYARAQRKLKVLQERLKE